MTNTTTNTTANGTLHWDGTPLPDPRGLISSVQNGVEDTLVSWGHDPYDTMFVLACLLIVVCIYFIATSGAAVRIQGGTKYLLYIAAFIGILWYLEVI